MRADKCEAELQRLLAICGGDWERVARSLFRAHPATVAEHAIDREKLARSFSWSSIPKRGRNPARSFDEIMDVLDRLNSVKYGRYGQLMHANRKSALKALRMKPDERARWEKILSGLRLPPWKAPPLANEVLMSDADRLDQDPQGPGCIACQGVD